MNADDYGVDAVANGLVFLAETSKGKDIGLRHGDSTDDWNKKLEGNKHMLADVGINGPNRCQQYISGTEVNVFIAAYTQATPTASDDDMWFAYDTADYPSRVKFPPFNDA